jgi:hypothetical protein
MPEWLPQISAVVTPIPNAYYWQSSPPICWTSLAKSWNAESGTQIQQGRLQPERGEIQGQRYPKRQDSYLSGSSGREGRAFTIVTGTWYDDVYSQQMACYGLRQSDGTAQAAMTTPNEVVSADTTTGIEDAEILLRIGFPPVETSYSAPVTHTAESCYTYLELAHGSPDGVNYRIAFLYGQPIQLQVCYNATATSPTWQQVAISKDLPLLERYLAQVNGEVRIYVKTSADGKLLTVEIGDAAPLSHSPDINQLNPPKVPDPTTGITPPPLPVQGCIDLQQLNGIVSMWYIPARYQPPTVIKSARNYGRPLDNIGNAVLITNALTPDNPDQTVTTAITGDGQNVGWTATGSLPDAGEGLGSSAAPVLSDATLIVPAVYDDTIPGTPDGYLDVWANLRVMRVDLVEDLNPVTCVGTTSGVIWVNNYDNAYSGAYGNVAIQITVENGDGDLVTGQPFVVLTGVAGYGSEGVEFFDANPTRYFKMNVGDKSEILKRSVLDTEWNGDGWAWPSSTYFLFERGQQHPDFLSPDLPIYITDNGTPYGPAGEDCPYYSWPRGTGNSPAMHYTNQMNPWEILADHVVKLSDIDPVTGLPSPYFLFEDSLGIGHFEPLFLFEQPIVAAYSDVDPTGLWRIMRFQAFNSVEDMRTELNWEGLDTNTYELLFSHLEQSPEVDVAVGFRRSWTERDIQYATLDYMQYSQGVASIQAGLPQQIFLMEVMAQPGMHAGMNITIQHDSLWSQGYIVGANIQRIVSSYGCASVENGGSAEKICRQLILARNILNVL